jgi:hypothetical protein
MFVTLVRCRYCSLDRLQPLTQLAKGRPPFCAARHSENRCWTKVYREGAIVEGHQWPTAADCRRSALPPCSTAGSAPKPPRDQLVSGWTRRRHEGQGKNETHAGLPRTRPPSSPHISARAEIGRYPFVNGHAQHPQWPAPLDRPPGSYYDSCWFSLSVLEPYAGAAITYRLCDSD